VSIVLVIQQTMIVPFIILPFAARLAQPYLLHYFMNGTFFGKKHIEHKLCVLIFSTNFSEVFLVQRRNQRNVTISVCRSWCKTPVILARC